MATFVAVHGAMHGGWAWGPVRRLLAQNGHDLIAPRFSGQGDRTRERPIAERAGERVAHRTIATGHGMTLADPNGTAALLASVAGEDDR